MKGKIRCACGLHDDMTDAFGGFSPTCPRCGSPSWAGPNSTARGAFASVIGVCLIFVGIMWASSTTNMIAAVCGGALLFLMGLLIIWKRA